MKKKKVVIIGGGPAALLLAAHLNPESFEVHIYEKNQSCGRKFLVAGKGGFNLSHSEDLETFISRYTPSSFIENALRCFTNSDLRTWFDGLGIPTFIGSSKRIYPEKGIKPIEVLEAILERLKSLKVNIHTNRSWTGWNDDGKLIFEDGDEVDADLVVFALGGASWSKTGSDGKWTKHFTDKGISVLPFKASNCAYQIEWDEEFINKHGGKPLKNISISCDGKAQKGELIITQFGLEGGAIYALSPQIRRQLENNGKAEITIDLKLGLHQEKVLNRLLKKPNSSWTKHLVKELKLDKTQIGLLKSIVSKDDFNNPATLAHIVKALPIKIIGTATLDEAISSVGGIDLKEVDDNFALRKLPNHYVLGEMLDWDAPTGGYLLQACFSMGVLLAKEINGTLID